MPTIPLYDTSAAADGWHEVRAPGGFEAWMMYVEPVGGKLPELILGFFDGFPFHPQYQHRLARYLRNPTRVAPPTPREYPCVVCASGQCGSAPGPVAIAYPPGSLVARKDVLDVTVGMNYIARRADNVLIHISLAEMGRISIETNASMTVGTIRVDRGEFRDCPMRFEHTFGVCPPGPGALTRFNCRPKIIKASSGGLSASRSAAGSPGSASVVERLEGREII